MNISLWKTLKECRDLSKHRDVQGVLTLMFFLLQAWIRRVESLGVYKCDPKCRKQEILIEDRSESTDRRQELRFEKISTLEDAVLLVVALHIKSSGVNNGYSPQDSETGVTPWQLERLSFLP